MISLLIAAFATVDMTKVEDAVWFVETSRREGMIWGDEGRSLGPLQISVACWKDALEFDPSIGGKYEDCQHLEYSLKIQRAYLARYCTEARLGRKPTNMDKARTGVGGPRGPWRKSSLEYGRKVIRAIEDSPLASWGQAEYKTTIGGLK